MEEGIDCWKGGGVGAYVVVYIYLVSAYRPSHSPLPQSIDFIPLLFHYSLKIGGGLGGADDREEALEGDQELDELLFVPSPHSLPCGPRMAEEKVRGLPAPSRLRSDGAG